MDFTREPVIESVLTPREGCKLVVRSSKSAGQEEYFVDAVEIVSFGTSFFFRSSEKPKSFLLPVVDYEVLEVREARMVLKHVASDRSIKIGKGEDKSKSDSKKEVVKDKKDDKKRERKRPVRRRKSKAEKDAEQQEETSPKADKESSDVESTSKKRESASSIIRSLLRPPPLIQDSIEEYRTKYSQAFYEDSDDGKKTEVAVVEEKTTTEVVVVEEPKPVEETPLSEEKKEEELWNFTDET